MKVWLIKISENLPIQHNTRLYRVTFLAEALTTAGHEVIWWASTFMPGEKHLFDGPRTLEAWPGLQLRLLHAPGYRKSSSPMRLLQNWGTANAFMREATHAVDKPDLIFCCLPTLELCAKAVAYGKRFGVPVIIDIRDLWPDHYLTLVPPKLHKLFKLVLFSEFRRVRHILKDATGITAISDNYLNWALQYAKRTRKATDGVYWIGFPGHPSFSDEEIKVKQDQLIAKYNIKLDQLIITYVGSMTPSIDLQTVVEAARLLETSGHAGVQFIIAGDGGNGPALRKQAQGLKSVIFMGWVDQLTLAAILKFSAVGLVAYADKAAMSLPNKPFEYMAAGLLLLSSLEGELASLVAEERIGLQYQAGHADTLVKHIFTLLAEPQTVKELQVRSLQLFRERFSTAMIYPRLVQHLEHVAQGKPVKRRS